MHRIPPILRRLTRRALLAHLIDVSGRQRRAAQQRALLAFALAHASAPAAYTATNNARLAALPTRATLCLLLLALAAACLIRPLARRLIHAWHAPHVTPQRLVATIDSVSDALLTLDAQWTVLTANSAALRLWGYDQATLRGLRLPHLLALDARTNQPDQIAAQIGQRVEQTGRRADGALLPLEVQITSSNDGFYTLVARDLTQHKQAEAARRESYAREQRLAEGTTEGLVISEHGLVLDANQIIADMIGYSLAEIIGTPATMFVAPSHRALMQQMIAANTPEPYEVVCERKDGTTFVAEVCGRTVYHEGRALRATAVHDITHRKQIELALQHERDFSAAVIDTAGCLVLVVDRRGHVVRFNATCERTTGYAFADVQQQPFWNIFLLPHERPPVQAVFEEDRIHDVPPSFENTWLTRGGEQRRIVWSNTTLADATGQAQFIVATGIDITARQAAEAALRASEQRERELRIAAQRHAQELTLLDAMRTALAEQLDHADVLRTLVDAVAHTCGYSHACLYMIEAGQLVLHHQVGYDRHAIAPPAAAVIDHLVTTQTALFQTAAAPDRHPSDPLCASIFVPVRNRAQVVGVLRVQSIHADALDADDVRLLTAVSDHAALAIERAQLYGALRDSHAHYRAVIDNVKDVIFQTDATGHWTFLNAAWTELTGLSVADSLHTPAPGATRAADQAAIRAALQPLLDGHTASVNEQLRTITRHGTPRWIEIQARVRQAADGTISGTSGRLSDVTKRKQIEEETSRQNEYLAVLHATTMWLMKRLDLADLLHTIADWAAQLLHAPHGAVFLVDQAEAAIELRVGLGNWKPYIGLRQAWGEDLAGGVWRSGQSIMILDYDAWPGRSPAIAPHLFRAVLAVPLTSGAQIVGMLCMADDHPERVFTEDDAFLLDGFAQIASIALDNARLYAAAQQEIAERKHAEALLRTVITNAPIVLYALDPQGAFTFAAGRGMQALNLQASQIQGRRIAELYVDHAQMQADANRALAGASVASEILIDQRWMHNWLTPVLDDHGGVQSVIGVSIDVTERKRAEAEAMLATQQLEANVLELRARTHELTLLNAMNDQLQRCGSAAEACAIAGDTLQHIFSQDAGAIALLHPSRDQFVVATRWGAPPCADQFVADDCIKLGSPAGQLEISGSGICRHTLPDVPGANLCVPLSARDDVLGVLYLRVSDGDNAERYATVTRLVEAVAQALSLVLANLKLRATLRDESIRDPLTRLFNRRYMEETITREMHRAARHQHPLGLIMLDVDHFKRFNDTYGHATGDALLIAVADVLQQHTRGDDVVCRYGGEEFVIVMPDAALHIVAERAETVRQAINRVRLPHVEIEPVTASFGVAAYPLDGPTSASVLEAADVALYRAKRAGRDRVVQAQSPLPEPQALSVDVPASSDQITTVHA